MILIIGGAYQGKLKYAKENYKFDFIDGENCNLGDIFTAKGIYNFHKYVKRMEEPTEEFTRKLIETNQGLVVISREIGLGVVPMDKNDREYREKVGRVCTSLAQFSRKVVRVSCGIGTVIKNQEEK